MLVFGLQTKLRSLTPVLPCFLRPCYCPCLLFLCFPPQPPNTPVLQVQRMWLSSKQRNFTDVTIVTQLSGGCCGGLLLRGRKVVRRWGGAWRVAALPARHSPAAAPLSAAWTHPCAWLFSFSPARHLYCRTAARHLYRS